jgi:hypothetical protein
MRTAQALTSMLQADFFERTRRTSFLVLFLVMLFLTYLFIPPVEANYLTVGVGLSRGIYNSPWVGTMLGIAVSTLMSLFSFYVVKNAIHIDRKSNVGQIIATTPTSKLTYLLGKWLGNLALLALLVCVVLGMALVMQLLRGESRQISLWALAAPLFFIGLPVLSIVAGMAVLFESISLLRGGFGNVVYFFLWLFLLIYSIESNIPDGTRIVEAANDPLGLTYPLQDMQRQVITLDPTYDGDFSIGLADFEGEILVFQWQGVPWTGGIILGRLLWGLLGGVLAGIAVLPFDRFDPSRQRHSQAARSGVWSRLDASINQVLRSATQVIGIPFQPLFRLIERRSIGVVLLAELRFALREVPWWGYGIILGLGTAGFLMPAPEALKNILPFSWLVPVLVWSGLGVADRRYQTSPIILSTPYPIRRQLPALWMAGFLVALLAVFGILINLVLAAEWGHVFALLVGAGFIPALALALGIWSGTSRLFELVYLLWWYLIFNGAQPLDFMGTTSSALESGLPWVYLAILGILLAVAGLGRYRQMNI